MSSSLSRSSRSTRRTSQENGAKGPSSARQSPSLPSITPSDTLDSAQQTDHTKTVQELRDELEELNAAKELLEDKVKQLEERVQYVEADARLSASVMAKENMDLKEKTRQLGIELSMVVDERDALTEKTRLKIPHPEVEEEARQMSIRLTDAWLKISNMKTSQEEHVQKLYKAEETNAKLTTELSKAIETADGYKTSQKEERKQWESERNDFVAEIESLKKKLTQSSSDGGKQVLDWEGDKARIRESFKYEKAGWDKEKKGYMDQIASLKVKMTGLSLQPKAPPPEWVLEKHQLVERCSNLQSRVTQLDSDNSVNSASAKRLEAENTKLSKKVDVLKAKLVEVMEHAKTMQEQADEEKTRRGSASVSRKSNAPARPRAPRRKATPKEEGEESDQAERPPAARAASLEITIPKKPPVRSTRARRTVNYHVDSDTSSEDLSDLESDEASDEDEDASGAEDMDEDEPEQGQSEHNLSKEESSKAEDTTGGEAATDMVVETELVVQDEVMAEQEPESEHEELTSAKRPASRHRKAVADDDSDSEFEPVKKATHGSRGVRGSRAKTVNVSNNNDSEASTKTTSLSKKRPNDADVDSSVESSKDNAPVTTASATLTTATTTTATTITTAPSQEATSTPVDSTPKESETDKASNLSADASEAPTTPAEVETPKPVTTEKVKKKRRLLKGKGLDELGDILNGPGSNLTPSSPSSGLAFGRGHSSHQARVTMTTATTTGSLDGASSSSSSSKKAVHANMDALNAIKLAFSVPKAKNPSP